RLLRRVREHACADAAPLRRALQRGRLGLLAAAGATLADELLNGGQVSPRATTTGIRIEGQRTGPRRGTPPGRPTRIAGRGPICATTFAGLATRRRARTVTITRAIATQHPEIDDVEAAIREGRVSVAGKPVLSTSARVPVSAPVVVEPTRSLRGRAKLEHALQSFAIDVGGRIALDAGAAAGGFTTALLEAGAARV